MRLRGRVIQCGTAANASWTPVPTGPRPEREILTRRLRWSGFIIFDHLAECEAPAPRLAELALAGKIVHDEEILPGLEHAPGAIARLYRGDNHGKLIIAADSTAASYALAFFITSGSFARWKPSNGALRLCGSSFQVVRALGVPPSTRRQEPVI